MSNSRGRQGGAAALVVTLILFAAMTLVAAFANRNHFFEARASLNQYRSTQAFEAAEAGLDWSIAMLNDPRPIDAQCVVASGAAQSLRERLRSAELAGNHLRAACVKTEAGWTCSCAPDGKPAFPADIPTAAPAFLVDISPDPEPHAWRLNATGCTSLSGECFATSGKPADAVAHMQATIGGLPSISSLPIAAVTAKGTVDAGSSDAGFHNADAASGGVTVHAGAAVAAGAARFTTTPGSAPDASIIDKDSALVDLASDRFFSSFFGMPKAVWKEQPGVKNLRCDGRCNEALAAAIGAGYRMVWIDGDARFDADLAAGRRDRPVVIVGAGAISVDGPVAIHGVLYAARLSWTGNGARITGAAVSESGIDIAGTVDFVRDATVLADLKNNTGSIARLPGSWRDF